MAKEWQADRKVPGLGLMVLDSGVRTYYVRYREPSGKQQHHKIGRAGVISLTTAREEALKLLGDVARGMAPTTARQQLRRSPTMQQLFERLDAEHYPKLRLNTATGYRVLWRNHILPRLGSSKAATITSADVIDLLGQLPRIQANRTLAVLRKAFNLAELWGIRPQNTNPCHKVTTGNTERKRRRYLTREELQRLLAALDRYGITRVRWRFAQLIRLLLLTGCRVSEIKDARWEWVQGAVLVVPADCHKTGADGSDRRVQLPPQALQVLEELRAKSNSEWIIQGDGDGHLIGYHRMWAQLLKDAKIENLRVHDLRHSFASLGLSAGLSLPQIGGLLGHASPQTTQRYAHLMDEAAAGMAAKVAALITR
jgi:integrase